MHADMEDRTLIGDCPFHRDRRVVDVGGHAQAQAGLDIVVIGEGDHRPQTEIGNLTSLHAQGGRGTQRRGPPEHAQKSTHRGPVGNSSPPAKFRGHDANESAGMTGIPPSAWCVHADR